MEQNTIILISSHYELVSRPVTLADQAGRQASRLWQHHPLSRCGAVASSCPPYFRVQFVCAKSNLQLWDERKEFFKVRRSFTPPSLGLVYSSRIIFQYFITRNASRWRRVAGGRPEEWVGKEFQEFIHSDRVEKSWRWRPTSPINYSFQEIRVSIFVCLSPSLPIHLFLHSISRNQLEIPFQ